MWYHLRPINHTKVVLPRLFTDLTISKSQHLISFYRLCSKIFFVYNDEFQHLNFALLELIWNA